MTTYTIVEAAQKFGVPNEAFQQAKRDRKGRMYSNIAARWANRWKRKSKLSHDKRVNGANLERESAEMAASASGDRDTSVAGPPLGYIMVALDGEQVDKLVRLGLRYLLERGEAL